MCSIYVLCKALLVNNIHIRNFRRFLCDKNFLLMKISQVMVVYITVVEEDWNDVIIECSSLSAKWEELSGYIGLSFRAIEAIQGDGKDTGNCWNKALKEWICQNYDTEKRHKPSWRTLLRAVAKVDKLFFDTLRRKHLGK